MYYRGNNNETTIQPREWKFKRPKAGVFIYNPRTGKILIVQSYCQKWGPPKGSIEECDEESIRKCAIREVLEETGILLKESDLTTFYVIDKTTYFYLELDNPYNLTHLEFDITGITWIDPECLLVLVNANEIDLNYHCKKCIAKFLHIPPNKFGTSPP
jgi:8-oxo-dGTP pyrophosphatase MutT (NUDIX family)